jgi:hypothetical protein
MDAKAFAGLLFAAAGVLMVVGNRRLGHTFRTWNTGHLLSPSRASDSYRPNARGRYPLIIFIGVVWIVAGVATTVLRLFG